MPNQRLINCGFVKDMEVSNKAKLLYLMFFINADDKGFVGNAPKIITDLKNNEENIDMVNTYENALNDLVSKGLVYAFSNNYGDYIYLIRHWYYHNKYYSKGWTNYKKYLKLVKLVDNEYILKNGNEVVENDDPQEVEQEKPTNKTRDELLAELESDDYQDYNN